MGETRIYGLRRAGDTETVYVGKTITSLPRRLVNHRYKARSGRSNSAVSRWIREMESRGESVEIFLLEETRSLDWKTSERKWIRKLRGQGARLLNQTAGGNGAHSRDVLSPEIEALLGKITDTKLAEIAGLSREAITYHRRKRSIPVADFERPGRPRGFRAENRADLGDDVIQMLGKTSDAKLARMVGVSRPTISSRRRGLGIPPCSKNYRKRGSAHGMAKLNEEKVRRIHELASSLSVRELSEMFGVHVTTVHDVLKKKIWRHVWL